MTPGRAALLGLMRRYLSGLLDPFVTLLEVHKLMYFMQEAGEPLRLRYVQAPYGPYAENLRHVLAEIDGYYISGFGDGGEQPGKELSLVPGAAEDADMYLLDHPDVGARFKRVADLVEGFETHSDWSCWRQFTGWQGTAPQTPVTISLPVCTPGVTGRSSSRPVRSAWPLTFCPNRTGSSP